MKKLMLIAIMAALAGCSTPAERIAECQKQGVSHDTCYLAEQNRQTVVLGASLKQSMENAKNY
jgi:Pyruvate/2-oxoacid:ferredoxin oxidoreductase gamma subunit